MKRLIFLLVSVVFIYSSCDVIDDPIVPFTGEYNTELYGDPPVFTVTEQTGKNVLVEDFTAHQCGNCPPAAVIAEGLMATKPNRVCPLAIHAGSLASTNAEYPTDWTCEEGDFFWDQLDFQANPLGRINRLGGPGNYYSPAEWADLVEQEMHEETPLELQMLCEWQGQYGHLNIHIHGQYFDDVEGDHTLSVLIEESYLIGDQLYYGNDPEHVTDYEFNHLLRGSVTGPQGLVVTSDATNGEHFQSDFSFEWNNDWVLDNCTVLAVVSDEDGYIVNCLGYHITN